MNRIQDLQKGTVKPAFTLHSQKAAVNTACIRELPDTDYVQIHINPATKKLIIRPCDKNTKDSLRWCSLPKRTPKPITCRIFFTKVFSLMEWDASCRYRLYGESIRSDGEFLFSFDLCTPEITAIPEMRQS